MKRQKRELENGKTNQCRYCKEPASDCICVRISCRVPVPNSLFSAIMKPGVAAALRKHYIRLGKFKHPDIHFMNAMAVTDVPENTILFERQDSCGVVRTDLLANPNVLAIVKSHANDDALDHPKVHLGPPYLFYANLDALEDYSRKLIRRRSRPIDVSFVGMRYNSPPQLAEHRQSLLLTLRDIRQRTGLNIVSSSHPWKYLGEKYFEHLASTKIVVSPFGHCPICYRDWEAVLGGCLLIKPSHSISALMHPPRIECKPDWSDLEELILWALENYNALSKQADINRKNAIKARKPARMAELIADIVNRVSPCGSNLTPI